MSLQVTVASRALWAWTCVVAELFKRLFGLDLLSDVNPGRIDLFFEAKVEISVKTNAVGKEVLLCVLNHLSS